MRCEKEGRKKQARSNKEQGKATHSTPKAVTFPKINELPRVGLEPTTLYTLHVHNICYYMYITTSYYMYVPSLNTLVLTCCSER